MRTVRDEKRSRCDNKGEARTLQGRGRSERQSAGEGEAEVRSSVQEAQDKRKLRP